MEIALNYQKLIDQIQYRITWFEQKNELTDSEIHKLSLLRKYRIDLIVQQDYFLGNN